MEKEAETQVSKKKAKPAYDSMVGQLQSKVEDSLSQLEKDAELSNEQSEHVKQVLADFAFSVHAEVSAKLRRRGGSLSWILGQMDCRECDCSPVTLESRGLLWRGHVAGTQVPESDSA